MWAAQEADPSRPPPIADPAWYLPCPRCPAGQPDPGCAECGGAGATLQEPPSYRDGEPWPDWLVATADVLVARNGIERFGPDGWLKLEGLQAEDLDPLFSEALAFLDAEIGRLEHEDRVRDAESARMRSPPRSK